MGRKLWTHFIESVWEMLNVTFSRIAGLSVELGRPCIPASARKQRIDIRHREYYTLTLTSIIAT